MEMDDDGGETAGILSGASTEDGHLTEHEEGSNGERIRYRLDRIDRTLTAHATQIGMHTTKIENIEKLFETHLTQQVSDSAQVAQNADSMRKLIQELREELIQLKVLRGTVSVETIAKVAGIMAALVTVAGVVVKMLLASQAVPPLPT